MKNRDLKDFFISILEDRGYSSHEGKLSKGFVIVDFMANGKMIRATDGNPTHSHKHIVTCKTPSTTGDADVWFDLLEIEKKEVGSRAWKVIKKRKYDSENNEGEEV